MTIHKNKNKNSKQNVVRRCNICLLGFSAIAMVVQLFFVNDSAHQQYLMSAHNTEARVMSEDIQRLSVLAASLESTERLSAESQRMHLVDIEQIRYIEPSGAVALRR